MTGRKIQLKGVLTAILTPFSSSGALDLALIPTLMEFQREAGIDGVVVCGTNGEGTSLSVEERKQVLETVMRRRGEFQVVAATGATSISDAIELTRHAADLGVDAALLLPPFFFKDPPTEGLTSYFLSILDAVDVPALLYNIPQMTAVPITDALLDKLAGHPRLLGIKDSAGDWLRTKAMIDKYPALQILAGSDYLALRCLQGGGAGCISGGANPFPELLVALRDAFNTGDAAAAQAAQVKLDAMLDILVRYPFVGASKTVLADRGIARTYVRPSLVNLTEQQQSSMLAEFRAAGILGQS